MPLTRSLYSSWIIFVTFPGLPLLIFLSSISLTGVISAAVPERNTSSAIYSSSLVNFCSITSRLLFFAIWITQSLVIPSKTEVIGVVFILLFLTINIFLTLKKKVLYSQGCLLTILYLKFLKFKNIHGL